MEAEARAIISRQQRREQKRREKGLPVHEMEMSEVKKAMKEKLNAFNEDEQTPKKKITPKKKMRRTNFKKNIMAIKHRI